MRGVTLKNDEDLKIGWTIISRQEKEIFG